MESDSLERVNEVLGKMSVEEAEEVVGQMGESGMLDMREGVIDSTTEEGQETLRYIKEKGGSAEGLEKGGPGVEEGLAVADPE